MVSRKFLSILVALLLVVVTVVFSINLISHASQSPLIVYAADSQVAETDYLLNGFHNATGTGIASAKGGGSYTDAREIAQGSPANVFVSVALEAYNQSYLGSRYSGWAVAIASDQLVLAYSGASQSIVNPMATQFSEAYASNSSAMYLSAFTNLTSGTYKVGIADPSSDPAGLRGWIALEIAGYLYDGKNASYFTDRMATDNVLVNGSSAATLVAPLISGNIQFLFIYRSAAISQGLDYISLPPQLNFGDPLLGTFYSNFTYSTINGPSAGSTIFLFVSALANNGNMAAASNSFVEYAISNRSGLSGFGLEPLAVPILFNDTTPPAFVSSMLSSGKLASGGRF